MKKILLVCAMAFTTMSQAQVVSTNLLSGYSQGDKLEKTAYTDKTNPINAQTWCGAFTSNPPANVTSPEIGKELSYSGYAENGPSIVLGSGFAAGVKGRRTSIYSLTDGKQYRAGTLYLSFLVDFSKIGSTKLTELVALSTSYMGGGNRGTIHTMRTSDGRLRFGLSLFKEITEVDKSFDLKGTHLVVLKLDFSKSQSHIFIDPATGSEEPTPDASTTIGEGDLKHAIRGISIRNSNGFTGNIGNFRLTKKWSDIVQ